MSNFTVRKAFKTLVVLPLFAAALSAQPLLNNLSTRAQVGTGSDLMVAGFAITGESKEVLIRAVGPGLSQFGLGGLLADPTLTIFDGTNTVIASNDNWAAAAASVFTQVGAFPLTNNSKDAALILNLPPGAYTAQVAGSNGGTGLSIVEVYATNNSGSARLSNLSTRAKVETGDKVMIPGLVITGTGSARRLLVRAVGPSLQPLGVTGFLADPYLALIDNNSGATLAANDNWAGGDAPSVAATGAWSGAFDLNSTDSLDAALVAELNPGPYTIQVSGVGGTSGVALVEVYDVTPTVSSGTLSVAATDAVAHESGSNTAAFTFTRSGDTSEPLIGGYSVGGTAFNGLDYVLLNGIVAIPAGQSSSTITVTPIPDIGDEPTETISLTVSPGLGYTVAAPANATASATLTSVPASLYIANLRPEAAATAATGYGTATILLSASNTIASVNVDVSNLSSQQTTAYLRLGPPGTTGDYIRSLPLGQVSGAVWQIQPTGTYTVADLVAALKSGLIYVGLETVNNPSGELRGSFISGTGSQVFVAPPAPPAAATAPATDADAARFLTQATFGPTAAEIAAMTSKTYAQWITEQMALPASSLRTAIMADWAANPTGGLNNNTRPSNTHRQAAWYQIALNHNNDQLRQRVAFALSEIFVISDQNSTVNNWQEGASHYYDLLVNGAFGNYRDLLEKVTLSPMMGIYLSHLRNAKADPVTGAQPDENYAREVMQLLSIGLIQLQPDGTLKLGENGLPIATYNQATITETAKVFTGWAFYNANITDNNFRRGAADYITPMSLYPTQHENSAKTVVGGVQIPADQGGVKDLKDALDALFNHANTAPFISRRLIQMLVTSNPSPGYVYRVASAFANNGSGVRGDLGAVVRAILLDYEARSLDVAGNAGFGKLKEPLLRLTALLRGFKATDTDGRFDITNALAQVAQMSLRSPTVFNFFEPEYVQPGILAEAGLYAPEFQILTASTAITGPNLYYSHIFTAPRGVSLDTAEMNGPTLTPEAQVDRLSLILAAGALSPASRDRIIAALNALPGSTSALDRIRTALYLVINSPDAAVQR